VAPRQRYKVTGHYVTAKTATSDGVKILGFHTGAILPPDVPPATIRHLLSVRLIAPLEVPPPPAPAPVVLAGEPPYDVGFPLPSAVVPMTAEEVATGCAVLTAEQLASVDKPETPSPAPPSSSTDDIEARRAEAAAKLAAAGGTPNRRHGLQVWVEYAVTRGYDRATAEAATKDELVALLAEGEQG
jgi:hypothetical protein